MFQTTQATKVGYANKFFQNSSKLTKVNLEKFTNFNKVNNDFFHIHDIKYSTVLNIQEVSSLLEQMKCLKVLGKSRPQIMLWIKEWLSCKLCLQIIHWVLSFDRWENRDLEKENDFFKVTTRISDSYDQ